MKNHCFSFLSLLGALLIVSGCIPKETSDKDEMINSDPVVVYDTLLVSQTEWDTLNVELGQSKDSCMIDSITMCVSEEEWNRLKLDDKVKGHEKPIKEELKEVKVSVDHVSLKKYNVVVASLSMEEGVARLKSAFTQAGIAHTVVKNGSGNLSHFVVFSSDSREEAAEGRNKFIANHAGRSQGDLLQQYGITMTDLYIWEKK